MGVIRSDVQRQRKRRSTLAVLVVLLGACALSLGVVSPSEALDLYSLHGTVSDASGVPLQGISIRNGGQGTTTDAAGEYRLGQLLPGTYTLYVSSPCHNTEQKTVTVIIPQDTRVDFVLTERWPNACSGADGP